MIPALALAWQAQCVRVVDGDTILIRHEGKTVTIRINGIDCPEKDQPRGPEATEYTAAMVAGKPIDIEPVAWDRYGRMIAWVYVGGYNLSTEILRNGLAWPCSGKPILKLAHQKARAARAGIWGDPDPVRPQKWRQ